MMILLNGMLPEGPGGSTLRPPESLYLSLINKILPTASSASLTYTKGPYPG